MAEHSVVAFLIGQQNAVKGKSEYLSRTLAELISPLWYQWADASL
jgi:hypothetical protein